MPLDVHQPATRTAAPSLDQLLEDRRVLREREEELSYWRRVVQGRLDLLTARLEGRDSMSLSEVLGGDEPCGTRLQHSSVRHVEPMPEIAMADRAWEAASGSDERDVVLHAAQQLSHAEQWLSEHRALVLRDLDAATAQLARRVAEDPSAYLRRVEQRWVASGV